MRKMQSFYMVLQCQKLDSQLKIKISKKHYGLITINLISYGQKSIPSHILLDLKRRKKITLM